MFKGRTLKKNAKFYTTVFLAGLVFLTTLISVGFAALNQNLNIAGQLEYEKHEVWAEYLSYDNTNTGVNCDTAQCMLDCLADDSLCPPLDFATASWSDIVNASQEELQAIMEAGTTKDVDLGTFGVHPVRIANVSTPSECSGSGFSQTACGLVIEFVDIITTYEMNSTSTNVGGWPASEIRTYVNSDIYNAIPVELRNEIINTTVVSSHGSTSGEENFISTDKIYLLSTKEIGFDSILDSAKTKTRILDYYNINNNDTSRIKKYNSSNETWWLRSAYYYTTYTFNYANIDGSHFYSSANNFGGVSPAFRIG